MAQFVAFNPHVEVSGQSMLITFEAMGDVIRPMLAKHGFSDIDPDTWYPQQPYLDFFREIASGDFQSVLDLVSIGTQVPKLAFWPPEIKTVTDALFALDEAYHMNHRNGDIGHYRATQLDKQTVEICCENPYPCDFDYGTIYGIGHMYLPHQGNFRVEHVPGDCRKHKGDACTYVARW
jgi:hypothetical protein